MAPQLPQRASWAATTFTHPVKESPILPKGDKKAGTPWLGGRISETGLAESVSDRHVVAGTTATVVAAATRSDQRQND